MNTCFFSGRLTEDPTLREYNDNKKCFFSIAVSNNYKTKEAMFIECNAWGPRAEFCSQYLKKGMRVFLQGHLTSSNWVGQDGKKNNKFVCVLDRIEPIFPPKVEPSSEVPEMPSSQEIFDEPSKPTDNTSIDEMLGIEEEPIF